MEKLLKGQKVIYRNPVTVYGFLDAKHGMEFIVFEDQGQHCIIEDPKGRQYMCPTAKLQRVTVKPT